MFISVNIFAQNSLSVTSVRTDASFEHIGVNVSINGDANLNSTMDLYYKVQGASTYLKGGKSMRAHPNLTIDGSTWNFNFYAASAMMLVPNSTYDLRMVLTDPNGGGQTIDRVVTTKAIPEPAMQNIKYVMPGNGGGIGTSANPYKGLQTAADSAQPGDHFIVRSGTYAPFSIENNGAINTPISFKSEVLHGATIDGNGGSGGIVVIGRFDNFPTVHLIIDGFIIEDGRYGIDAQHTQFLTVRNNIIQNVDIGFVNRRENGFERDQYITNNQLLGNSVWPNGSFDDRGIDIRGNNNVISFNTITDFGDGISTDGPPYRVSYSLDIYNNEIKNTIDDHIEVDGMVSNTRIYNNRCFNGRAGVSLAPVFGGPAYVFRNVIFNTDNSALKMNRQPSGLVVVNNTIINARNAMSSPSGWQNTYYRNNVVFASKYCFEEYGLVGNNEDWDYGAYYNTRSGGSGGEWFKWDNVRYGTVADLQASGLIEANSIELGLNDLLNAALPTAYSISYDPSQRDFRLTGNSPAINSGMAIDNLDRTFVTDGLVDRGALEDGQPLPVYGAFFGNNTCGDGVENGLEEFVDCGGPYCTPCNDCPYPTAYISDQPIQSDLNLKTSDWIITDGVVPSNGNIILKAGNCVGFGKDFEVINGATMRVYIDDCN